MTNDIFFEIAREHFGYVPGARLAEIDREVRALAASLRQSDALRPVIQAKERLDWLHQGGGRDPEGYEWGVFRVKWNTQGQPESVLQTLSDFSDLDNEMERERSVANLGTLHSPNGLP